MIQDSSVSNKRKYPRLAVQLGVKYKLLDDPNSPFIKDITNSIGEGGIFIRTKDGFQKDTKVQIEFSVDGRVIQARGIVRYLIPYDASAGGLQFPGMGIQFTMIAPDDQEFVGNYVNDEMKKQGKTV